MTFKMRELMRMRSADATLLSTCNHKKRIGKFYHLRPIAFGPKPPTGRSGNARSKIVRQ